MYGSQFLDSVWVTSGVDACYQISEEFDVPAEQLSATRV